VQITCNATLTDANGFGDITGLNGSLYDTFSFAGVGAADVADQDNNSKYFNSSCFLAPGTGTSRGGECQFTVQYYANNATWACNLSVFDASNKENSTYDNSTFNVLAALNVPGTMYFGSLNLGDNRTNTTNVTNTGNVQLGIKIYGYANNQSNSSAALNCTTAGGIKSNITLDHLQYNVSHNEGGISCRDFGYGLNSFNLTNSSNEKRWNSTGNRFKLFQRQNDAFESKNATCWVLRIPQAGEETIDPGGVCTGVLSFVACQVGTCGDDTVREQG